MSMHRTPLTPIEEEGLRAHGLDIGTPSQLSDAFRQGVAWGQNAEREACAKFLDGQKFMTLEPLRKYSADEVWQTVRSSVKHLAAVIRRRTNTYR